MAIFDEIYNYYPDRFLTPGLSEIGPAEGVIALLLGAATTRDRLFSEDDLLSKDVIKKVSIAVSSMKLFREYSQDEVGEMFTRIGDFYRRYGAVPVIEEATRVVPPLLREAVFAIAADSVLTDRFRSDGFTTLFRMADVLKISRITTKCVIEFMKIRTRS